MKIPDLSHKQYLILKTIEHQAVDSIDLRTKLDWSGGNANFSAAISKMRYAGWVESNRGSKTTYSITNLGRQKLKEVRKFYS